MLLLVFGHAAWAEAGAPRAYLAIYDLSIGMLELGAMRRELRVDANGAYVFESRMETRGLASLLHRERVLEVSRGRIADGRFIPETYEYDNSRKKRHFVLSFDQAGGFVKRTDGGAAWEAPMPRALLDKLVYQAQLMRDLAGAPQVLRYDIADKDELKTYLISNRGREDVETHSGSYSTLRLERGSGDGRRHTTVWCAEALGWLPVKVDYRDKDGTTTTAILRSFEPR